MNQLRFFRNGLTLLNQLRKAFLLKNKCSTEKLRTRATRTAEVNLSTLRFFCVIHIQ